MAIHVLQMCEDSEMRELLEALSETNNNTRKLLDEFCEIIADEESFSIYYNYLKELGAINE